MFERFTDRARRVVVLAQEEARMLNHNYIGTEHILLGLIHEGEGVAAKALESLGISLEACGSRSRRSSARASRHRPGTSRSRPGPRRCSSSRCARRCSSATTTSAPSTSCSAYLTQAAREGKLDPVIGRDEEIRRVMQVLSRRTKNNPVLIGEPGVGKTAVVEGLAQRIVKPATCPRR
jgi:ATP-dependent Clp protease ATP-binding subunit ClpC